MTWLIVVAAIVFVMLGAITVETIFHVRRERRRRNVIATDHIDVAALRRAWLPADRVGATNFIKPEPNDLLGGAPYDQETG